MHFFKGWSSVNRNAWDSCTSFLLAQPSLQEMHSPVEVWPWRDWWLCVGMWRTRETCYRSYRLPPKSFILHCNMRTVMECMVHTVMHVLSGNVGYEQKQFLHNFRHTKIVKKRTPDDIFASLLNIDPTVSKAYCLGSRTNPFKGCRGGSFPRRDVFV